MSIFDLLRFPINDFEDARNIFPRLPESIRDEYLTWYNVANFHSPPDGEDQLSYLRKLIGEYNDDI